VRPTDAPAGLSGPTDGTRQLDRIESSESRCALFWWSIPRYQWSVTSSTPPRRRPLLRRGQVDVRVGSSHLPPADQPREEGYRREAARLGSRLVRVPLTRQRPGRVSPYLCMYVVSGKLVKSVQRGSRQVSRPFRLAGETPKRVRCVLADARYGVIEHARNGSDAARIGAVSNSCTHHQRMRGFGSRRPLRSASKTHSIMRTARRCVIEVPPISDRSASSSVARDPKSRISSRSRVIRNASSTRKFPLFSHSSP
jgi:hypothetical protein